MKPLPTFDLTQDDVAHVDDPSVDRFDSHQLSALDARLHAVAVRPKLDGLPTFVSGVGLEPTVVRV